MESKLINVSNDYYQEKFNVLCEELEKGTMVHIYVDCIGHTRAEWVEADYVQKLKQKYGDRLKIKNDSWKPEYILES